jgi:Holliday junction resolvase RusA-like endonuclease
VRVNIKPLSVNLAWQGQRFKTPAYKAFETELLLKLPNIKIGKEKLSLRLIFAFSNASSDLDNPTKLVQDILSKKYGFNDKQIYELHLYKLIVDKGKEYLDFEFQTLIA